MSGLEITVTRSNRGTLIKGEDFWWNKSQHSTRNGGMQAIGFQQISAIHAALTQP
jgi:hypothetical protein